VLARDVPELLDEASRARLEPGAKPAAYLAAAKYPAVAALPVAPEADRPMGAGSLAGGEQSGRRELTPDLAFLAPARAREWAHQAPRPQEALRGRPHGSVVVRAAVQPQDERVQQAPVLVQLQDWAGKPAHSEESAAPVPMADAALPAVPPAHWDRDAVAREATGGLVSTHYDSPDQERPGALAAREVDESLSFRPLKEDAMAGRTAQAVHSPFAAAPAERPVPGSPALPATLASPEPVWR
jgi:hypothetical protein